ncbi:helix-turn-helix domain-containing protein [Nocardioides aquiterrae]|uniref:Cupin domain-containing protein n=1 Tax=Nocardioides aquiterrae TaxID=203799 RepID=A0ABN1UG48_9ACTN
MTPKDASAATPKHGRGPQGTAKDQPSATDQTIAMVGARIRTLRSRQNLTLKDVADRTGVSVSMLSMLERGVATASVGTLVSVASALGVHMYDLFDHPAHIEASPVTPVEEQTVMRTSEGTIRRVAHHDVLAGLELAVNTYEAGGASGPVATHHDGREFGVLISGALTVELDGEQHVLRPGDVIAYNSTKPHRISNPGDDVAVAVWVNLDAE